MDKNPSPPFFSYDRIFISKVLIDTRELDREYERLKSEDKKNKRIVDDV